MIEILIVISIIIVLVGIVAFGLSKVTGTTKTNATVTTMGVLKSMIAEFEVTNKGLTKQPPYVWQSDGSHWPPGTYNIWRDGIDDGPAGTGNTEPDAVLADKGELSREAGSARYEMPMVGNTQLVMGLLLQAPGNRKIIEQTSPTQMMEELPTGLNAGQVKITIRDATGSGNIPYNAAAASRVPSPPLLLDGWGNPLIFVPGGGMYDVRTGDVTRGLVKGANGPTDPGPVRSPDGRPFFASAGPDGILSYIDVNNSGGFDAGDIAGGDDNIYSFEQH